MFYPAPAQPSGLVATLTQTPLSLTVRWSYQTADSFRVMYQGDDDVSGSTDVIIGTNIEITGSLAQQISSVQVVATFDGREGESSEWVNVTTISEFKHIFCHKQ